MPRLGAPAKLDAPLVRLYGRDKPTTTLPAHRDSGRDIIVETWDDCQPTGEQGGQQSMSVVVSVNLADGVILAVDSAVTLPGPPPIPGQPLPPDMMQGGVLKVYEDAAKLFPLGDRP